MISLQNISLYQGVNQLLKETSSAIYQGQKIGIIGRNGCGKSSLFKLLMNELSLDAGEVAMPSDLQKAQMLQETKATASSALDYVVDGHKHFRKLEAAMLVAEQHGNDLELARLHAELELIDAWSIKNRAEQLLSGLGFNTAEFAKSVGEFSGGWRIRLNLAQALMQDSDLLLLDEPTNHLDLEATLWLRQWLQRYEGTLLLISHDRLFLDEVVSHILSFENKKLISYRGNYSAYEKQKVERLSQQQAAFEKQQSRKKDIEDFVRRFRAQATKARQAQSRLKELERMTDIEPAHIDSPFQFRFPKPVKTAPVLLTCEDLAAGYAAPLFRDFSLSIASDARIGLLGPNGQGKSTLLKTLAGELSLLEGKLHHSDHLVLGYCAQHQVDVMDGNTSPLAMLQKLDPKAPEQDIRNFLGTFDFQGSRVDEQVLNFSGGEKSRLALASVAWQKPNMLLMDEPTNHLDLEMCHALTRALQEFGGALILVSHDRHLLNNTVDQFLLIRDGGVEFFEGSLDDYEKLLLEQSASAKKQARQPSSGNSSDEKQKGVDKKESRQEAAKLRQLSKPLRDKVNRLEKQFEKLSGQLSELETRLATPEIYEEENKAELTRLLQEQGELKSALTETEEAWFEAQDELENFTLD